MDKNTRKTAFGKYVEPLNMLSFYDDIENKHLDKYTKKLFTRNYMMIFLFAILQECKGLRAIEDELLREELQLFLGMESISYSQLSRKHNSLDPGLLHKAFLELVMYMQQKFSGIHSGKKKVKIIDSTTISLSLNKYKWAEFRKTKSGIKLHLRLEFLNANTVIPEKLVVTPAKQHDRQQLDTLVDNTDCMYVFDRGYLDFRQFDYFCDEGVLFTTRVKSNTYIDEVKPLEIPEGSSIFNDSVVIIGTKTKRMNNPLRLVEFDDQKGRTLQVLTNNFTISAQEVADLYRSRWAIELFFKWMKQNLQINHMFGTSQNAVWNQIYLTMISFCLLVLAKNQTKTTYTLQALKRRLTVVTWVHHEKWWKPKESESG